MVTTACRGGVCVPARRGFTLLELLMVIAIIILLMGLLLPAIAAAMNVIRVAKTASFMGTLGIGLESFKDNFGYYPPSGAGNLYTNLMGPNEEGWP
ncbi:MAG: prepilin-type N-terminal cleavage/methylation domain-containing protein, partial [Phycisphaerae bacterium]|nr:prepilin-type N-terminal cleavage/methylation domain-containing protein [Phycisphaerae bacterium]